MLEKSCAMQAEKEVSLSSQGPKEEGRESNQNSNPNIASSASIAVPQFPAKKPTRQWAAWTHQEEESFFTALRQVGKNFAKITSRVQSKNKDQVRHYYYRLVRRMNKLLGPELSLDAKNPKDTNAAMLRWWSLLEKYSCKASKLHLKPRRFKLFLEALEHQLLKDRRKSSRKRACHGERLDSSPFKLILCDSQNVRPGRASTKHGESLGVRLGDEKEDTALGRAGRQRRKQAGYRKWEKAAIDGVSLVADAAEHLERTSIDKDVNGQKDLGPTRYLTGKSPLSLPSSGEAPLSDANMQFSAKLKLQLFPIDESTRRSLEADKHNPHLELTLSNRKKISSVLEHLNRKWGSSSCACGELMLFPYNARKETVALHQRWTNDSFLSAVEVYSMVGSPSLFRLRYGWFVQDASGCLISQVPTSASCPSLEDNMNVDDANEVNMLLTESGPLSNKRPTSEQATSVACAAAEARDNYEPASAAITPFDHLNSGNTLSAGAWADSLTNISIGDLLSEAPDCVDPPATEGSHCLLRDVSFASDSFDAAIAAHILRHQNKPSGLIPVTSGSSSLWDDEDTRDAFSFQKTRRANLSKFADVASNGEPSQVVEATSGDEGPCNLPDQQGDPMEEGPADPPTMDSPGKTIYGLADVYWPDSLGPLDLDIRSSKYAEDLNLSDSLGGLSRLIATSLDAFQNCSLFGFDSKKDKSNMV
ncbi:BnaC04g08290D [Brassica napus]|uniref:BnaC04g08290D protein n=1 Tax=Brassica napus TaxID=3708 RepID=A0A078H3J5_BRANA|nr:BnaC04g08290D [Brassica napus]